MAGRRQYTLFFYRSEVATEKILVRGKDAIEKPIQAFDAEKCLSSMWAVSVALCAFDLALDYSRQRQQFSRSIGEFQGIRWMLAEMAAQAGEGWVIYES